jgi:hypothetical protein
MLAALAVTLVAFVALAFLVKAGLDANDWIDRCADNSSHRYIENERDRSVACKK